MTKSWAEVWDFRTSLYSLLGNLLLEPIKINKSEVLTTQFWLQFPIENANEQLDSGLQKLKKCTDSLSDFSKEKACERVMVEYTKLFIGPGKPAASLFESFYHSNKVLFFGEPTVYMKNLLRNSGLESIKKDKQPEDHLGLQLLFISLQSEKLLTNNLEEQISNIGQQIEFINQHLLSWIPTLRDDAGEYGTIGFYNGLFELLIGVLKWDIELLEEFLESEKQQV